MGRKNLGQKTRQSFIWFTTIPFVVHMVRFIASIILARILSPSDFGIMGIISVIVFYSDTYSDLGFGKALIQRKWIRRKHYTSYFSFNLLISLLLFTLAQAVSEPLSLFYEIPELSDAIEVSSFLFLITAIGAPAKSRLGRDLKYKALAIIEAIKISLLIVVSLSLALEGYAFWSLIYAMLASQSVAVILYVFVSGMYPRLTLNLKPLKDLAQFGLWDFLSGQSQLVADSADKLIIGKVLSVELLGFYDRAQGLARMPNDELSVKISQVSFSAFSRIQDDTRALKNYLVKIQLMSATILLPLYFGLAWVAEDFVTVLLGEKWLPMVFSLQIFALSYAIGTLANPFISMNNAVGLVRNQTVIRLVLTVLLVTCLLVVAGYGIEFAAVTFVGFNLMMLVCSIVLLQRRIVFGMREIISNIASPTLMVMSMIGGLAVINEYAVIETSLMRLITDVSCGALFYAAGLMFLPVNNMAFIRERVWVRVRALRAKF